MTIRNGRTGGRESFPASDGASCPVLDALEPRLLLSVASPEWMELAKLLAGDGAPEDYFSWSVAISGDTAVIGSRRDDDRGNDSGSAYVFRQTLWGWQPEAKLTAGDGAAGDSFGCGVAISGDVAIIGARGDDDQGEDSGSAYVFRRTAGGWTEEAKLAADDGAAEDLFGWSVSISGDVAIVGAQWDDDQGGESGSAYIFRETAGVWQQEAKLTADDGAAWDSFGWSVSINGDTAIVGAYGHAAAGSDSGAAYIYHQTVTGWEQAAELTASDASAGDSFGYAVSINGATAIVGAYAAHDGGAAGAAYVFRRTASGWQEEGKLLAHDGADGDWFGYSVAVSGDIVVVGAQRDDDLGNNSGSAYIFQAAQVVMIGDAHARSVRFTDADGTIVTTSLSGGGTASVFFVGNLEDAAEGSTITVAGTDLAIAKVVVNGATVRSTLSFSTRGGSTPGATIGSIYADGTMSKISGKTMDLTGDLSIAGLLKTLQLGDVADGHLIEINAAGLPVGSRDKITMTFDRVADTSVQTHGLPINSLTATEWVDGADADGDAGVVEATYIGRLTTKGAKANAKLGIAASNGDFEASLVLSGENVPARKTVLGSASIRGDVGASLWDVTGPAGSIRIYGQADGWELNVNDGPPGGVLVGTVRSLTVGDVECAAVDVADAIGSVKAVRWATGWIQADSIGSLSMTGSRGNARMGIPAIPGDFAAGLELRGQNVPARKTALNSARIAAGLISTSFNVLGDVGSITAGTVGGHVFIQGNARSIRLTGEDLALVPAVGGSEGVLEIQGTVKVTAGRTRLSLTGGTLYTNDRYQAENDLRYLNRPGAWWNYDLSYRVGREKGTDTATTSVVNVVAGAYDAESKSDTTYATDDLVHYVTGPAGEVCVAGFRFGYSAQEYLEVQFDNDPAIMPELIKVGETYTATDHFTGTFAAEDDGLLLEGTVDGTATAVTKVRGYEQVTVPSGTYLAVKVETTTTIKNAVVEVDVGGAIRTGTATITDKRTSWFVPEVGEVKTTATHTISVRISGVGSWSYSESITQELTAYNLP